MARLGLWVGFLLLLQCVGGVSSLVQCMAWQHPKP